MTISAIVSSLLQLACAVLLCVRARWRCGWPGKAVRVLRQLARDSTRDDVPILLKSPRVPAVSVVMVARDAIPQVPRLRPPDSRSVLSPP